MINVVRDLAQGASRAVSGVMGTKSPGVFKEWMFLFLRGRYGLREEAGAKLVLLLVLIASRDARIRAQWQREWPIMKRDAISKSTPVARGTTSKTALEALETCRCAALGEKNRVVSDRLGRGEGKEWWGADSLELRLVQGKETPEVNLNGTYVVGSCEGNEREMGLLNNTPA